MIGVQRRGPTADPADRVVERELAQRRHPREAGYRLPPDPPQPSRRLTEDELFAAYGVRLPR